MPIDAEAVEAALRKSWSLQSARQWTAEKPAYGQCNVTALAIEQVFGGDILKTPLPEGDHYYNRIDGGRFDFTASQFDHPIDYADILSSRQDAARGATQLRTLSSQTNAAATPR